MFVQPSLWVKIKWNWPSGTHGIGTGTITRSYVGFLTEMQTCSFFVFPWYAKCRTKGYTVHGFQKWIAVHHTLPSSWWAPNRSLCNPYFYVIFISRIYTESPKESETALAVRADIINMGLLWECLLGTHQPNQTKFPIWGSRVAGQVSTISKIWGPTGRTWSCMYGMYMFNTSVSRIIALN